MYGYCQCKTSSRTICHMYLGKYLMYLCIVIYVFTDRSVTHVAVIDFCKQSDYGQCPILILIRDGSSVANLGHCHTLSRIRHKLKIISITSSIQQKTYTTENM